MATTQTARSKNDSRFIRPAHSGRRKSEGAAARKSARASLNERAETIRTGRAAVVACPVPTGQATGSETGV